MTLDLPEGEGLSLSSDPSSENFSLKEIQHRLRARADLFLETSVDGIHILDRNGILVDLCDSFAHSLGYSRQELEGRHVSAWDARWSVAELSEIVRINTTLPQGEIATFESIHRRKDGSLVPVEIRSRSLWMEGEVYLFNSARDISDQKISQARIRSLSEQKILLVLAGAAAWESSDEQLFLQTLCDLCVRHGEMALAWIGSPDSDGNFVIKGAAGVLGYMDGLRISCQGGIPEGEGPTGRSYREGRPFFNNNFSEPILAPWTGRGRRWGLGSNAALPIEKRGETWGVLTIYHRDPDAFRPEVQDLFRELARTISRGLDHIEVRRAEKEMATLQEALLDNTLAGIALVRGDRFKMANARFLKIFGYEERDLGGAPVHPFLPRPGDLHRVLSHEETGSTEELLLPDIPARRREGEEFFVDLSVHPLPGTNTMVWTVVDVSERHHLQERNTRISRFNLMLARANHAIATLSDEEALLRELCELGVRTGDLELACIGTPDEEGWIRILAASGKREFLEGVRFSVREEHPEGRGAVGLAFRTGLSQFNETFASTSFWKDRARSFGFRSGGVLPVLRNGKPWGVFIVYYRQERVLLADLKIILDELVNNVSRGLDLIELQEFRSILSRALAVVSDGAVVTGRDRRVLFLNRAFTEITGYGAEELSGQDCRRLLGPGSDPAVILEMEKAVASGQAFKGEILHYRKDGKAFWNQISITPIRNESGKLTHFVEIHRDVTQIRQMAERLAFESRHDDLTGLPNRRSLESHLDRVLARAMRQGTSVAVGVLDLNNFKPINDDHGHEAGDALLRDFSQRVRTRLRETDFLARLGGDEFVLVIEDLPRGIPDSQIGIPLERLHEAVETPYTLPKGDLASVGMSLGLALFPEDGTQGDELIRKADLSMYGVKDRKLRGGSWWQRGVSPETPGPERSFDPFGPETLFLLEHHKMELQRLQEYFVEDFTRVLSDMPEARGLLGSLSKGEVDSLKERQVAYLSSLLLPRADGGQGVDLSRHLGEVHALTGVPDTLLLRSKFHYSRLLFEHLNRSRLSVRDRLQLYLAIEVRLDRDLEVQLDSAKSTIDRYFETLSHPVPPLAGEADKLGADMDRLSRLPGISAVLYGTCPPSGFLRIHSASGDWGEKCRPLWDEGEEGSAIATGSFPGKGVVVEAVKSGECRSGTVRFPGSGTLSEETLAKGLPVRSILALPLQNLAGEGEGVLVLLGRYPNQFASPWMQRFANALLSRWVQKESRNPKEGFFVF